MQTRLRTLTDGALRDGAFVLYWMTSARRPHHNHALDHALALSAEVGRPLLVLEPLRIAYPHASRRLHAFVIDGMRDNAQAFAVAGVTYHPYVEPAPGEGRGLIEALARDACAVVTDDYPVFFLPRMLDAAAEALDDLGVRLDAVDANGILPMRHTDRAFARAVDFRRHLQKVLPALYAPPAAAPSFEQARGAVVPKVVVQEWPANLDVALEQLPLAAVPDRAATGGWVEARARLKRFVRSRLTDYASGRHPDAEATSALSAHLHFGHIGAYEVFEAVTRSGRSKGWNRKKAPAATAKREGWWGLSEPVEAFLEQLCTWRDLAFNGACNMPHFESFEGLPAWAHKTLQEHAADARSVVSFEHLEAAKSGDEVWDAAQRELLETGVIQNYLRMTWGKKVLEWSASPEEAWDRLVLLNDRYALDGRDPNSYASIGWIFGRYDRAWGPERPIFGKVRYMSSDATKKKLKMKKYLAQYGPQGTLL